MQSVQYGAIVGQVNLAHQPPTVRLFFLFFSFHFYFVCSNVSLTLLLEAPEYFYEKINLHENRISFYVNDSHSIYPSG